ncbi:unnamed protein product, partial [Mesorhabditis spiculigera]
MPGNSWYAYGNELLDEMVVRYAAGHPKTRRSRSRTARGERPMGARMGSVNHLREDGCHADFDGCGVDHFSPGRQRTRGESYRRDQSTRRSRHLGAGSTGSAGGVAPHRPSGDIRAAGRTGDPDDVVHLGGSLCPRSCLEGSALLPTVFGLEAMSQAAAYVTGRVTLGRVRIDDIKLID